MVRRWNGSFAFADLNRRAFIGTSATVLTGAALFGYTTEIEPHWLELVHRDLVVPKLPASLDGKRLAHVSDLHVCSYVEEDYLVRSLGRLAALAPDIIVFTGDFVTWQTDRTHDVKTQQLERVLSHFPRGRLATLAVPGNHDYGETWQDGRIADHIFGRAARAGIRVLRNEVANVEGLDIIGLDDLWSGRASTRLAFAGRTSDAAITLCHNPDGLDVLSWKGYSGWVLAGHTHGGQCKPPFLPPPILPVKNRRYTSGEIDAGAGRTLYISRGVGHLYEVRFNVRPEITVFTLRSQAA